MFINSKLNFIDLFAGAGGLSEGFIQAGFNPIAHVEMNKAAACTLETRAAYMYLKKRKKIQLYYQYERGEITREELFQHIPNSVIKTVINAEMSKKNLPNIFCRVDKIMEEDNVDQVDVIVGGPPCQAYSLVGRAQSSHMRVPMEKDPRNELYIMYTRFLEKYRPKMFVFENVLGIKSARNGEVFDNLKMAMREVGYIVVPKLQNAADFGVLQNRKRMIIIGWRDGTDYYYPEFKKRRIKAVVRDLLDDLAIVNRGCENNSYKLEFDECSEFLKRNKIRTEFDIVTHHVARANNPIDVQIYKLAIEAYNNENGKKISYDKLPDYLKTHKNQTAFKDRFKVVEGNDHTCHTVLAHLAKDGHYFIHPDIKQCRSITVREAARLQTFPDNYYFEGNRGEKFKQIGNAVPPMMAKIIAKEIKKQLAHKMYNR